VLISPTYLWLDARYADNCNERYVSYILTNVVNLIKPSIKNEFHIDIGCVAEKHWFALQIKFDITLQALEDEEKMTPEQVAIKNVGKQVKHLSKYVLIWFIVYIFLYL
jgi:hypothetical protein